MVHGFENVCEIFFSSPFNVFVFTTFWPHLWSITEQTHGNIESINFDTQNLVKEHWLAGLNNSFLSVYKRQEKGHKDQMKVLKQSLFVEYTV